MWWDDIRHIYSTFPIIKRQETAAYRQYRSGDFCSPIRTPLLRINRTPKFLYEASAHSMKIAEIDFPSPLLSALRDDELVIFAGAGVSMGEPACLPSFKKLAENIAQGTDEVLQDGETEDRFLGRLHDKGKGVEVHERAVRELSRNNPKPTALHKNLLRLHQKSEQVRVVTTNFDLLFEEAAQDVSTAVPKVSQAPGFRESFPGSGDRAF